MLTYGNSERLENWIKRGKQEEKPAVTMHDEIDAALLRIGETDNAHGYWVIGFYAHQNHEMHSDVFDQRLQGNYGTVLEIVENDIEHLDNQLTGSKSDYNSHCLNMALDFRKTWFELRSSGSEVIWQPNARAQIHSAQLAKDAKTSTLAPSLGEIRYDKLQKQLVEILSELKDLKDMVSKGESLSPSAATTPEELIPNSAQKRALSNDEVSPTGNKRRKSAEAANTGLLIDED